MRQRFINYLLQFQNENKTEGFKLFSLFLGMLFFLIILPSLFIWIGLFVNRYVSIDLNRTFEIILSILSILFGLFFLAWSTLFQWKMGKGVPAPNAPTQQLVVSGPYRLCRNPIELGAIFYYLGVGTLIDGIVTGVCCFLLGLIIGSLYHKYIEEKELEVRFGEAYREYKKETPFLFPKLIRKRKR